MRYLCALFFALALLASELTGAGHGREWSFRVLLDGKDVGSQHFRLEHTGETVKIETEASIRVKFLFATVFRYSHRNVETWNGDCLQEISSSTRSNNKSLAVSGQRQDGYFSVAGVGGQERLPECVMSFAYWDPAFLDQARLLNPQDGNYLPVDVVGPVADEREVKGSVIPALRYGLNAKNIEIELWYSRDSEWVALESTTKGGRTLRYELL